LIAPAAIEERSYLNQNDEDNKKILLAAVQERKRNGGTS